MKYIDEYRGAADVAQLAAAVRHATRRPWTVMEICGGQTHALMRFGIGRMLPEAITLVHGPGCPVCVTPLALIDRAVELAGRPGITLASFGDMLRVPGSREDLLSVQARGGDVRIVYSPLDALRLAIERPALQVVFFAVGFETTAPANAMAVRQAHDLGVRNFSILCSHVLVPPAMEAILGSPRNRVQAFLAAGHVCTVMGTSEYEPIAARHRVPIVVTGFEPVDLLDGLLRAVTALEAGRFGVEIQYARAVRREGNAPARAVLAEVFEACDREWRGIGTIPASGYRLRARYRDFDAERRFDVAGITAVESPLCIAGEILQGLKKPPDCSQFGAGCTPESPLGAPMVSSEGACAAYHRYARPG
jgi:hydrogenase expression/formation protein HypD